MNGPGTCLANAYVLNADEGNYFTWYSGLTFPANQQVNVTVNFNPPGGDYFEAGGICFELYMRESSAMGAKYDFGVCPDGSWGIFVPGAGSFKAGKVAAASSYTISASCIDSTLT